MEHYAILMHYYVSDGGGAARLASVFWDEDEGREAIASSVTESNNELTVNTYATVEVGSLMLSDAAGTAEGSGIVEFVESTIQSFIWAWPSMEAAHFIGMALVFGSVTVMGLRVLGVAKSVPFSAMHRLLPLGALGLLVNVITGVFFFIADSGRYVAMDGFPPKIIWLVIGAVAILYFTIFDEIWKVKSGEDAPIMAKLMAVLTILSWGCVLVFGRLLPYYGDGG